MATDDENTPPGEDDSEESKRLLNEEIRDPDEAVVAEQAIHHYATERLDEFREEMANATETFSAWLSSQGEVANGILGEIGKAFLHQMVTACGGTGTPIGAAMFEHLDGELDEANRFENEASFFLNKLESGARDVTWYVRDNLSSLLSNEWDKLLHLAYEGDTYFIPALHAYGLPQAGWSGAIFNGKMTAIAEQLIASAPKTQEEAVEKDPEQERNTIEQVIEEEEEKQQAV